MYACSSPVRCACLSRCTQLSVRISTPAHTLYPSNAPNSLRIATSSSFPHQQASSPTPCHHGLFGSIAALPMILPDTKVLVALHRTVFPEALQSAGAPARTCASRPATDVRLHHHYLHILSNFTNGNSTSGTSPVIPSLIGTSFTFIACLFLLAYIQYTPAAQAQLVGSSGLHISRVDSNAPRVQPSPTSYDPVSAEEREASSAFSARVETAVKLLEGGRRAQSEGDFEEAFRLFTQVVEEDGDLALSSYARVGRALSLYQVGDRSQAILELEDMSVDLKGYPEIHAALAAAFYADKHALKQAEQQFTLASLMDKRYTDVKWVVSDRHWPPSLVVSLRQFLDLS